MRAVLAANGVQLPLPLDMARDVAEMLLLTGRAVHPAKFVDAFIGAAENETPLPHEIC